MHVCWAGARGTKKPGERLTEGSQSWTKEGIWSDKCFHEPALQRSAVLMSTLVEKQVTKNEFCVKSGYVGSYSFFFFFVFVKLFPSRKGPSLDILVCMLEVNLGERWFSCCKNITSKGVLWKISQTWESRANYEFWYYLLECKVQRG